MMNYFSASIYSFAFFCVIFSTLQQIVYIIINKLFALNPIIPMLAAEEIKSSIQSDPLEIFNTRLLRDIEHAQEYIYMETY